MPESVAAALPTGSRRLTHVLLWPARAQPYHLPPLTAWPIIGTTPKRLRLPPAPGRLALVDPTQVRPVPDRVTWQVIQYHYGAFQAALTAQAAALLAAGWYPDRYAAAGAPRLPLCPTVIAAVHPRERFWALNDPWQVPAVARDPLARHTPKMLELGGRGGLQSQAGFFCCPDDATWARIAALRQAAVTAAAAWQTTLRRLGSAVQPLPEGALPMPDPLPPGVPLAWGAPATTDPAAADPPAPSENPATAPPPAPAPPLPTAVRTAAPAPPAPAAPPAGPAGATITVLLALQYPPGAATTDATIPLDLAVGPPGQAPLLRATTLGALAGPLPPVLLTLLHDVLQQARQAPPRAAPAARPTAPAPTAPRSARPTTAPSPPPAPTPPASPADPGAGPSQLPLF